MFIQSNFLQVNAISEMGHKPGYSTIDSEVSHIYILLIGVNEDWQQKLTWNLITSEWPQKRR